MYEILKLYCSKPEELRSPYPHPTPEALPPWWKLHHELESDIQSRDLYALLSLLELPRDVRYLPLVMPARYHLSVI